MTDIFKSAEHQSHFNQFGYVVIDSGLLEDAEQMEAFIKPLLTGVSPDFYYSLIANDLNQNRLIRDKIRVSLQSFYDRIFTDYKPLNESFLVKPAQTNDELLLHQDWCYTYEGKFHSLTLWMPLCDVDENNGALFLVPGSHKWFNNIRSAGFPTARIASKDLPANMLHQVNMKKGQVMIFHPATFHGSFPNKSNQARIVITSVILPGTADYVYFQAIKDNGAMNVKTYKLDEDAFLRELKTMAVGAEPCTWAIAEFHYNHPVISPADLLAKAHD